MHHTPVRNMLLLRFSLLSKVSALAWDGVSTFPAAYYHTCLPTRVPVSAFFQFVFCLPTCTHLPESSCLFGFSTNSKVFLGDVYSLSPLLPCQVVALLSDCLSCIVSLLHPSRGVIARHERKWKQTKLGSSNSTLQFIAIHCNSLFFCLVFFIVVAVTAKTCDSM